MRDKVHLPYRGSIKGFMRELATASRIIVVYSRSYLESENSMYELYHIWKQGPFTARVFPIKQKTANIHRGILRSHYVRHWNEEYKALKAAMQEGSEVRAEGEKPADVTLLQGMAQAMPEMLAALNDMNAFSEAFHREDGFDTLIKALQAPEAPDH